MGCGCTTNKENKECCKCAVPCYAIGLKWPERLCAGAGRFLCIKSAQSFPFHPDYVEDFVCAYYGIQCAPECSCCGPKGTECPALDRPLTVYKSAPSRSDMIRDDDMGGGGYSDGDGFKDSTTDGGYSDDKDSIEMS